MNKITGQLVDIHTRRIFPAQIRIENGRIAEIEETADDSGGYIIPGFVDAHVHVESSMLPPAEFARMAVVHGTVATVSDPHEIANVLGVKGVEFMLDQAKRTPFKFCFGAPSCVPATVFETAGAQLDAEAVASLLARPDVGYLSEVMNFPGVLAGDPDLLAKIAAARRVAKPVDGHAPGMRGADAARYASAGITTDHECFTLEEAIDKLAAGMWILIREGSAARNFAALEPLLKSHPSRCMLCTDDMHPDTLERGHINRLVARAVAGGADVFNVLRCASLHPVGHYHLNVGLLRVGDPADFVIVEDLREFVVKETWIDGQSVAREGKSALPHMESPAANQFHAVRQYPGNFAVSATDGPHEVQIIGALNGEIVTQRRSAEMTASGGQLAADPSRDLLKIAVVNRYKSAPPAVAFLSGFGLKSGALASSVAHDSHNIVAIGATDEELCEAVNLIIENQGGLSVVGRGERHVLPLPIAGLMAVDDGYEVAASYSLLDAVAKSLGTTLQAPFMTLSFMALLVIPDLKLSDKGLFSGAEFRFVPLTGETLPG